MFYMGGAMKKKKIVRIIIILLIASFIITDRVRFKSGKEPIFALPVIGTYDVSIYNGFGYRVTYGYRGSEENFHWYWLWIIEDN